MMINERNKFKAEAEMLAENISKLNLRLKSTEEDNIILSFCLSRLKSVIVERIPLERINLMNYNLEYLKYALLTPPQINNNVVSNTANTMEENTSTNALFN